LLDACQVSAYNLYSRLSWSTVKRQRGHFLRCSSSSFGRAASDTSRYRSHSSPDGHFQFSMAILFPISCVLNTPTNNQYRQAETKDGLPISSPLHYHIVSIRLVCRFSLSQLLFHVVEKALLNLLSQIFKPRAIGSPILFFPQFRGMRV